MAERQNPSRRTAESKGGAQRQTTGRRVAPEQQQQQQAPSRRNDVIRCENCGEDYSITYKRCPFCDERPGRGGVGGRRSGGSSVHPVQLIGLILSLVLIIAALFIVFKYIGPLLFGDKDPGASSSAVSSSQSDASTSTPPPASSEPGDVSVEQPPALNVTAITLSREDFTLKADEKYQITVAVIPAEAADQVVWTSSHPNVITVDQEGNVQNINTGSEQVKTTITATCGELSAECTVYCRGSGTAPSGGSGTGGGTPSGGSVAANSRGVISASSGLNIRSGPGSNYEKIASADNGAEVTILEDTGTGWYKIDYGNGKVGYVSSDYVKVK